MQKSYFLFVAVAGFLMPFLTGFLGILPLDQSIIFEAGGRIAIGEKPFSDLYLPYGLVPALAQAAIFKVVGVSWFNYVLHAALINCIFAILVLDVLRIWLPKQNKTPIVLGALLASWAFYPMIGTPFMDNHSFFFAFVAYWSVLAGIYRGKYPLLLICFPCMVLGFYSKPLPVIFWIVPIATECWLNRHLFRNYFKWIGWSVVIALAVAGLPFAIFDTYHFYYYTFYLPFRIGQGRVEIADEPLTGIIFGNERYKIWACLLFLTLTYVLFRIKHTITDSRLAFYRAGSILFATVLGAALTKNTFYNLFSIAGVLFLIVLYSVELRAWQSLGVRKIARFCIMLLCIIATGLISQMNFSRRANEFVFRLNDLKKYSPELGIFLKSPGDQYSISEIRQLYQLMSREHCLYIGDMMLLYSLTKSRNPWPLTHLHDGTSYNSQDSVEFADVKLKLLNNLMKSQTTCIISDHLVYGPEEFVVFVNELKGNRRKSFGRFVVYGIDKEKLAWMVSNLNTSRAK
ncbi:MAG TPA: hypothetical protein VEV87_03170 [Chitinophagaceae bacterium]|nr:hypothetical protein [Chitinophagaceae bacterium]